MKTNKQAQQAMYAGSITMNEYVFAKAAPVLLETLVLLIDRYPEFDAEIQQMIITARANVSDQFNRSCGEQRFREFCQGKMPA